MLGASEFVLVMEKRHLEDLARAFPQWQGQAKLLGNFLSDERRGSDVPDPYYGSVHGFEDVYLLTDECLKAVAQYLQDQPDPGESSRQASL